MKFVAFTVFALGCLLLISLCQAQYGNFGGGGKQQFNYVPYYPQQGGRRGGGWGWFLPLIGLLVLLPFLFNQDSGDDIILINSTLGK